MSEKLPDYLDPVEYFQTEARPVVDSLIGKINHAVANPIARVEVINLIEAQLSTAKSATLAECRRLQEAMLTSENDRTPEQNAVYNQAFGKTVLGSAAPHEELYESHGDGAMEIE